MLTIDIVLLILVLGAGIIGLFKGFIKSVGMLIGGILSIVLSIKFHSIAASILPASITNTDFRNFLGIIITFIVLSIAFGLVVELLSKIFKLPVINIVNRILGFAFGVLEAIMILGVIFMLATKYTITYNLIKDLISNSFMVPLLIKCVNIITPLLPDAIKGTQEIIPSTTTPVVVPTSI